MTADLHASDPVPSHTAKQHIEELLASLDGRLSGCRLISYRSKLTKTILELEHDGRRLIGKVSKSPRSLQTFRTLALLWDAGMQPPSHYTVSEPVLWDPERGLLLQAKAEGDMLLELIQQRSPRALAGVTGAAEWLAKLQALPITPEPAPDLQPIVERCRRELSERLPGEADRITTASDALLEALGQRPDRLVPSHGDFHPMNIFARSSGRITAIDLDTFGGREQAADTGYFVAQLAIMGTLALGDLRATRELREEFLRRTPAVAQARIDAHVRLAFLRTLHYDLCILKLGDESKVERFLNVVEHGLE